MRTFKFPFLEWLKAQLELITADDIATAQKLLSTTQVKEGELLLGTMSGSLQVMMALDAKLRREYEAKGELHGQMHENHVASSTPEHQKVHADLEDLAGHANTVMAILKEELRIAFLDTKGKEALGVRAGFQVVASNPPPSPLEGGGVMVLEITRSGG